MPLPWGMVQPGGTPVPPVTAQCRLEHIIPPACRGTSLSPVPQPGTPEGSLSMARHVGSAVARGEGLKRAERRGCLRVKAPGSCRGAARWGLSSLLLLWRLSASQPLAPISAPWGEAGKWQGRGDRVPRLGRGLGAEMACRSICQLLFFCYFNIFPFYTLAALT